MSSDQPAARKLLFGALFVGASALPAGAVCSGLLAGVGGNWVAEAFGGVIGAGPPPGVALTRAFHEELAREPEAWRLYHGWLFERMAAQSAALQAALAAQPAARATLADPAALEDRLDSFGARLDAMLAKLREELRAASGADIVVDQSEQADGASYGAFNSFGADQPPAVPPAGKTRVDQSKQKGGVSYGAFNRFGKTPPPAEDDDTP